MIKISLNDNEKTKILCCYPESAACDYYDRMTVEGFNVSLRQSRAIVKEYIDSLNLPTPDNNYLQASPIIGLKTWKAF